MKLRRTFCFSLAALLVLAGVLFLSVARAQFRRNIRTKDFAFPQYYDQTISPDNPTNRLKLLLRGAVGQMLSEEMVGVTTARLEHYPASGKGTNLVAISPYCVLNSSNHTVTSTGRIDIAAKDARITIEGNTGFYFDMTNYVLIVSNRSRTVVRQGLFQQFRP